MHRSQGHSGCSRVLDRARVARVCPPKRLWGTNIPGYPGGDVTFSIKIAEMDPIPLQNFPGVFERLGAHLAAGFIPCHKVTTGHFEAVLLI